MPSVTTATISRYRRRESARSLVQRLHAIPVQLLPSHVFAVQCDVSKGDGDTHENVSCSAQPPAFDAAPSAVTVSDRSPGDACGELGVNSVCLIITSAVVRPSLMRPSASAGEGTLFSSFASPAAEQLFAYEVAAAHVLRGGRVLYLSAPASRAFSLAKFVVTVERQWLALQRVQQEDRTGRQRGTPTPQNHMDRREHSSAGRATESWASRRTASSTRLTTPLSPEDHLRARQRAVLEAVRRIEALTCTCMEDLHAVCQAYAFPTTTGVEDVKANATASEKASRSPSSTGSDAIHLSGRGLRRCRCEPTRSSVSAFPPPLSSADCGVGSASAVAAAPASCPGAFSGAASTPDHARDPTLNQVFIVPLCIVDGLIGPTSSAALLERASGQAMPLPHYLLCLLQRRLKCALVVVEGESGAATNGVFDGHTPWASSPSSSSSAAAAASVPPTTSRFGGHPRTSGNSSDVLPSPAKVLAASDLVRRLCVPHAHPCLPFFFSLAGCHPTRGLVEISSEVIGVNERRPGKKAGRPPGTVANSALTWASQAPPVAPHDVQLSVVYIESDAVWQPLRSGGCNPLACDARNGPTLPQDRLLLPGSFAWRYRVHLMKTTVGEAAGALLDSTDHLPHNRSNSERGSHWLPSRGANRSSRGSSFFPDAPANLQYTGAWVGSTQWRHL
ncbi:hypothetical protein JKF63_04379 [Porcisia hertigi]|uniref:Uncharacterized protein n=1 Tax=Porcisia hertigi TaxID=2761500 RepID=A0A836INN7_9TRYP|nr:hypothetical protein JKF63_04379 [Porcisia hertigi]